MFQKLFSIKTGPALFCEREGAIQLGLLPFYHIFAIIVNFMSSLAWGQTSVIMPNFEPKMFLETIQKYKVTQDSVDIAFEL